MSCDLILFCPGCMACLAVPVHSDATFPCNRCGISLKANNACLVIIEPGAPETPDPSFLRRILDKFRAPNPDGINVNPPAVPPKAPPHK